MRCDDDHVKHLLARGRESARPGFLSRLEGAAQGAYRREERARHLRLRLLVAALAVAAAVPLLLALERPDVSPITPETLAVKKDEQPQHSEPRPAVPHTPQVPIERPAPPSLRPRPPALGQEVAVLAKVRQALHDGDAKQALAVLNQRRAELQGGQLRLEAEVLRLEALSSLGATKEASERARVFIDENPNSPLVDRVRGYLAQ